VAIGAFLKKHALFVGHGFLVLVTTVWACQHCAVDDFHGQTPVLFPDAKLRKNSVEQIVGPPFTDQRAQFFCSGAEIERDAFTGKVRGECIES
jgi:hypothetical protein